MDGRLCRIILPPNPKPGRLWIWKPEFFGAYPIIDEEMVRRGYHWVYLDVIDHYGCPKAISHGNALYEMLTRDFGFHRRVGFAALSRGGLFAYNWTLANPGKVAAIYADNAVADFRSWPGGKGIGPGSEGDWEKCRAMYGLDDGDLPGFSGNPIENVGLIAKGQVPLLQVYGDADEVVPISENALPVRAAWQAARAPYSEIIKPGGLHHPHGLDDPSPIADFFEKFLC